MPYIDSIPLFSYFGQDPELDCVFPECPATCTLDTFTCPDGQVLVRDPANNCEFPPCTGACPLDTFTCPNGQVLVRDPANNCEFPPCPIVTTNFFMLAAATDGCLGRLPVSSGDELLLLECDESDDNVMWRLDANGKMRSKVNETECVQAGQRPEISAGIDNGLASGSQLYVKECALSESAIKAPFQEFDDMWASAGLSGPLSLEERPDLCVVSIDEQFFTFRFVHEYAWFVCMVAS